MPSLVPSGRALSAWLPGVCGSCGAVVVTALDPVALVGFAAAALVAVRAVPQWVRARRDVSVEGVSGATWALSCASGIAWTAYSVAVMSWPLVIGTGLALAGSAAVFGTLVRRGALSYRWVVALATWVPVAAAAATVSPEALGWFATVLSLSMRVPQLVRTVRTRSLNGLSRATWVLSAVASGLWVVYGVFAGLWPVVLADGWSMACAVAIVLLARAPRERDCECTHARAAECRCCGEG